MTTQPRPTGGNMPSTQRAASIVERVAIMGDLAGLQPAERVMYYRRVCESLGLNPLTKPFDYLQLDGKLVLYAKRDATDQLREIHGVSISIVSRVREPDVYRVTARASNRAGRQDEAEGIVVLSKEDGEWKENANGKRFFRGNGNWLPLKGPELANAMMKAETKAKRRVTLSICGLGYISDAEAEDVPNALPVPVNPETGEILSLEAGETEGEAEHTGGAPAPVSPTSPGPEQEGKPALSSQPGAPPIPAMATLGELLTWARDTHGQDSRAVRSALLMAGLRRADGQEAKSVLDLVPNTPEAVRAAYELLLTAWSPGQTKLPEEAKA